MMTARNSLRKRSNSISHPTGRRTQLRTSLSNEFDFVADAAAPKAGMRV
jgi:hypothetical protein